MNRETKAFIREFVKDLSENNAAIFAGAGMSIPAGFVDWSELLAEIAEELGLDIERERDLISLAQFHVNEKKTRARINKKIIEEFIEDTEITENHRILSRLPISTYWTTNYDSLVEDSIKQSLKVPDIKSKVTDFYHNIPKRDSIVYKMHGDAKEPKNAVLLKEDYESYHSTHEPFVSALKGDLITKTFLFIGFSFNDPNLDYILSRVRVTHDAPRMHYFFVRKPKLGEKGNETEADYDYNVRRQVLMIGDLKRYGIQLLVIDEYSEIETILAEIENQFRKKTVFISGSAVEYGNWTNSEAQEFVHKLSKEIILEKYKIVNGFGWGVGSAVINGALDAIYNNRNNLSENQLILRPFPQFETGEQKLPELWTSYRQRMTKLAGIAIFLFGNKHNKNKEVILADGVIKEFEISLENGLVPIPVGLTGYASEEIYKIISDDFAKYYGNSEIIINKVKELALNDELTSDEIINKVLEILKEVNKV